MKIYDNYFVHVRKHKRISVGMANRLAATKIKTTKITSRAFFLLLMKYNHPTHHTVCRNDKWHLHQSGAVIGSFTLLYNIIYVPRQTV